MANMSVGTMPNDRFIDKRRGRGVSGANVVAESANMTSVSALRSRLQTLAAASYTNARLDAMTVNDMIYALRLLGDSAGIK